jgi:hypothetical protein
MEAWFEANPEERAIRLGGTSAGRFADGYRDLGAVALFLGSPECFLTGQTLQVDGGVVFS